MSYLALLFCQDEKTARTITQVLSELDFQVDPCAETFAAVKKLTTQAFDAVVVDCQSEENASLLLKAARNSASNQASLMVALVEGQAGVAAAFRIGANLVLTTPIAVEQARSTLRVARGLLRKNAGTVAAPSAKPTPTPIQPAATLPTVPAPTAAKPAAPRPPAASVALPPRPVAPPPTQSVALAPAANRLAPAAPVSPADFRAVASSSNLQSEAEHQPSPDAASAGLLEALDSKPSDFKPFDFKPFDFKPSSLKPSDVPPSGPSVAEIVSVSEVDTGAHQAVRAAIASKPPSSQEFGAGYGSAAAAAPAREVPAAPPSAIPAHVADLFEPPVFSPATAAVHSASETSSADELNFTGTPVAARSRTPLVAAVVLLACAASAYYGWTQLRKPATAATAVAGPLQPPPPDFGASSDTPAPTPARAAAATPASDTPVESVNRFAHQSANNQIAADQVTTPIGIAPSRAAHASASAPLQVKAETPLPHSDVPQEAPVEAPSIATQNSAQPDALSAIAHSSTSMPSAPSNQRVSQGVLDGLLIKRVQPIYPAQAIQMHTQGTVSLTATIAKDGSVRDVKIVKGPATLARAATDAVRQWKYRPYTLNGEPIEVQTEININFVPPR